MLTISIPLYFVFYIIGQGYFFVGKILVSESASNNSGCRVVDHRRLGRCFIAAQKDDDLFSVQPRRTYAGGIWPIWLISLFEDSDEARFIMSLFATISPVLGECSISQIGFSVIQTISIFVIYLIACILFSAYKVVHEYNFTLSGHVHGGVPAYSTFVNTANSAPIKIRNNTVISSINRRVLPFGEWDISTSLPFERKCFRYFRRFVRLHLAFSAKFSWLGFHLTALRTVLNLTSTAHGFFREYGMRFIFSLESLKQSLIQSCPHHLDYKIIPSCRVYGYSV